MRACWKWIWQYKKISYSRFFLSIRVFHFFVFLSFYLDGILHDRFHFYGSDWLCGRDWFWIGELIHQYVGTFTLSMDPSLIDLRVSRSFVNIFVCFSASFCAPKAHVGSVRPSKFWNSHLDSGSVAPALEVLDNLSVGLSLDSTDLLAMVAYLVLPLEEL